MAEAAYDRIGLGYSAVRQPEPKIAARLETALGEARTVLNVGAGTGSYEPHGRAVTAVEPSLEMIAQRPPGAAPVIKGVAESLPFDDESFDAAMAVITIQHWSDVGAGLAEMARVARERMVILTFDPALAGELWFRDYFPSALEYHASAMPPIAELTAALLSPSVEAIPVPRDCADGFFIGLWDRPGMHLNPRVRRASSCWHQMPPDEIENGLGRLKADLDSGRWEERNGHLRELSELDVGLRLVTSTLA
jgi:SAM-dependent methyltransferase